MSSPAAVSTNRPALPGPGPAPALATGSAETVDVARRIAKRLGRHNVSLYVGGSFSESEGGGGARADLERLIAGSGVAIVVQPIVNVPEGRLHAYERSPALRPAGPRVPCTGSRSPMNSDSGPSSS